MTASTAPAASSAATTAPVASDRLPELTNDDRASAA